MYWGSSREAPGGPACHHFAIHKPGTRFHFSGECGVGSAVGNDDAWITQLASHVDGAGVPASSGLLAFSRSRASSSAAARANSRLLARCVTSCASGWNRSPASRPVLHDASFIKTETSRLWWNTFLRVLAQAAFIVLVTLLIIRWSITGPIARTTKWIRDIRAGKSAERSGLDDGDLFQPLAQEVTHLAKSLEAARAAAEEEARLRENAEAHWTPERLRVHVRSKLGDRPFFVVSNREPYTHTHRGKNVEVAVPASGLVTAIEPILRTCKGTWLAHGSGDADREMVDERDRLLRASR